MKKNNICYLPIIYKKKKRKRYLMIVGIIGVIGISMIFQKSYAKYKSQVKANIQTQIAKPVLQVETEQSILITANKPKQICNFVVKNYQEENQINEIEMEYYIEFIGNIEECIQLQLYKNKEPIAIENKKTKQQLLQYKEKQEDYYILEVAYEKEKSKEKKDMEEQIEIKIHAIQKAGG